MEKALRAIVAVPAILFAITGIRFIIDPAAALGELGVAMPDGMARSTIVGDLGAFFIALSAMILMGVVTLNRIWLQAATLLIGSAALMRIIAWMAHGAPFAAQFIVVELVVTAVLFFGGNRITARS